MKKIYVLLIFCLSPFISKSQTSIEWPNGRLQGISTAQINRLNDSIMLVSHDVKNGNNNYTLVRYVNTSSMNVINSFYFSRPATSPNTGCLFFRSGSSLFGLNLNNDGITFPITFVRFGVTSIDTLFTKNITDKSFLVSANLIDDKLFTFRSKSNGDTSLIEVFDTTGISLNYKFTYHAGVKDSNLYKLTEVYTVGPYQHPLKSNVIVFGNNFTCKIIELNKQTLEVEYVMPHKFLDLIYSSQYIYGYELLNDRIACGGTVVRMFDIFTNPDIDFEMYFETRTWSGDSIIQTHFGVEGVDDRAYAFTHANGNYVLAGASPFNNAAWQAAEYREAVIYKFNDNLVTDTLKLFGTKNHVPMQLHADDNGDLYVLSTYTDSWTTDSTFYVLTKIPAFVMDVPEMRGSEKRVFVYPNPTTDYLVLSDLPFAPKSMRIYSQGGQLVQNVKIEDERIDVTQLPNGVYVLVITDAKGSASAVTFVKQ